jgi:cation-transporting ATPase 13A1
MTSHYLKQGLRIIALAVKDLEPELGTRIQTLTRQDVEHNMELLGLFVLRSPLKPNTAKVIKQL